jgi:hypothetical protein
VQTGDSRWSYKNVFKKQLWIIRGGHHVSVSVFSSFFLASPSPSCLSYHLSLIS